VRALALEALGIAAPDAAVDATLDAIASRDLGMRDAARATLSRVDVGRHGAELDAAVARWSALALADGGTAAGIAGDAPERMLLRDAITARARSRAVAALSIETTRSRDRDAATIALRVLEERGSELANALETLEAAVPSARPLLALWETEPVRSSSNDGVDVAARDADPFIRACADLVRSGTGHGGPMTRTRGATSPIERVLALRAIPLFAELEPADVAQIAAIAAERTYSDGEVIGAEGELGDEMHVVVVGVVRVERDGETIAERGPGDIIGEMSIITRAARIASLIAQGDVRTLRIGNREFEGMLRERPEIAIAVMRVLAERLSASSPGAVTQHR
jgi:hypothetical protein